METDTNQSKLVKEPSFGMFLEDILKMVAAARKVSANVYLLNESSVMAEIDSGYSGSMSFIFDKDAVHSGAAHSYLLEGNGYIKDELAKIGISSELVDMGPEKNSREVRFAVPPGMFESSVNAIYTAFKKLELSGV